VKYLFSSDDSENNAEGDGFDEKLFDWFQNHKVSKLALTDLLKVLKPYFPELPLTSCTFLKKFQKESPCNREYNKLTTGEFAYIGLQKALSISLDCTKVYSSALTLKVNIDGLPLYKSSKISLWTILVQIPEISEQPFLVAVHSGDVKPNEKDLLIDFVNELNEILLHGITVGTGISFMKNIILICDAPARSMVKCIKEHWLLCL
jgi:hypothetical protein